MLINITLYVKAILCILIKSVTTVLGKVKHPFWSKVSYEILSAMTFLLFHVKAQEPLASVLKVSG